MGAVVDAAQGEGKKKVRKIAASLWMSVIFLHICTDDPFDLRNLSVAQKFCLYHLYSHRRQGMQRPNNSLSEILLDKVNALLWQMNIVGKQGAFKNGFHGKKLR